LQEEETQKTECTSYRKRGTGNEGQKTVFLYRPPRRYAIRKKLGATTVNFGAFARFWWIDDSEYSPMTQRGVLVVYGLEPENRTYEVGAIFSLYF
jgi:hypothetical protein